MSDATKGAPVSPFFPPTISIDVTAAKEVFDAQAHAAVAQASAQAVQNMTATLQNLQSIISAAYGAVMTKMTKELSTNPPEMAPVILAAYQPVLIAIQGQIAIAGEQYVAIGSDAATVLKNFPPS